MSEAEGNRVYIVLINDEEQYSLWLQQKAVPPGWRAIGVSGTQDECSRYVDEVWTDMRPRSLRQQMESGSDASGMKV